MNGCVEHQRAAQRPVAGQRVRCPAGLRSGSGSSHRLPRPTEARRRSADFLARPSLPLRTPWPLENQTCASPSALAAGGTSDAANRRRARPRCLGDVRESSSQ